MIRPVDPRRAPGRRIVAVILAGGRSRRMGVPDKCFCRLGGKPLLDHVIDRLRPQVEDLVISANGDPVRFSSWGLPIIRDVLPGWRGPLVGLLSALEAVPGLVRDATDIVSVPADMPFLPYDLVKRLEAGRRKADTRAATGVCGGRINPLIGLWPLGDAPALRAAIETTGLAKAELWASQVRAAPVSFERAEVDPFFNVNNSNDLAVAERLLRETGSENPVCSV